MPEHSEISERFACYDRATDILWLPTAPAGDVRGERTEWGVLAREVETGEVVSLEIWSASSFLPDDLLNSLPEPPDPDPAG